MADLTLADLAEQAGVETAAEATADTASSGSGEVVNESTAEFLTETIKTLEKRGLIEPILFGPDYMEQPVPEQQEQTTTENGDTEMSEIQLNAETVATAGRTIMSKMGEDVSLDDVLAETATAVESIKGQLGDDATVQDIVQIAENNPELVDQQLEAVKEGL